MGFEFFGSDEGGWGASYEHDDQAPELLACPFCGQPAAEICNTHSPSYWVQCNFCDAEGPGSDTWDGWTPETRERCEQLHVAALNDAARRWNTRCSDQKRPMVGEADEVSVDLCFPRGLLTTGVVEEILSEVGRATEKFPTWPTDPLHALAVLGEEYGELNKEMLQLAYEPRKTSPEKVRAEATQTAAMALRLALSLGRYEYRQSDQHRQSEGDRLIGMRVEDFPAHGYREDGLPD